jgi:hypothetical protein
MSVPAGTEVYAQKAKPAIRGNVTQDKKSAKTLLQTLSHLS